MADFSSSPSVRCIVMNKAANNIKKGTPKAKNTACIPHRSRSIKHYLLTHSVRRSFRVENINQLFFALGCIAVSFYAAS